jgi:hypothetical protein
LGEYNLSIPQEYATLAGVGYKQMSNMDPTNTKIILPQAYATLAGVGYKQMSNTFCLPLVYLIISKD